MISTDLNTKKLAMNKRSIFITIAMILSYFPAFSQSVESASETKFFNAIRSNQKNSYITFGQGVGNIDPLIFEAYVSPFFLLRLKDDAKWGATLTPAILLRMYNEKSLPVKTPSYMPQITFYQLLDNKTEKITYTFLTLAHHSNGQADSFFLPDGSINTLSGSFSTNFIEFGLFFNKRLSKNFPSGEFFQSSLQIHLDVDRTTELEKRYSFYRWNNNFRVFRFPIGKDKGDLIHAPKLQTTVETTWLFGKLNDVKSFDLDKRFNFSITFNYHPEIFRDISFFLNFYSGADYYNIYFNERINALRIGIQAFTFR